MEAACEWRRRVSCVVCVCRVEFSVRVLQRHGGGGARHSTAAAAAQQYGELCVWSGGGHGSVASLPFSFPRATRVTLNNTTDGRTIQSSFVGAVVQFNACVCVCSLCTPVVVNFRSDVCRRRRLVQFLRGLAVELEFFDIAAMHV